MTEFQAGSSKSRRRPLTLKRYCFAVASVWTVLVVALGLWDLSQELHGAESLILSEARTHLMKDQAFRLWGSAHGGVYVPPTEHTPPSPYLAHVPDRDVVTVDGKKLTLMSPAYMVGQIMDDHAGAYGVRGRMVGMNPLRPSNEPDAWERRALLAFERGEKEIQEFREIDGELQLRMMRPLLVEQSCLKCHEEEGHSLGTVLGGVGVSVPTEPFYAHVRGGIWFHMFALGLLWILGISGLAFGIRHLGRRILERDIAEEALAESRTLFQAIIQQSPIPMAFAKPDGELTFNSACASHLLIEGDPNFKQGSSLFELKPTWSNFDLDGEPVAADDLPLQRALRGHSSKSVELRIVRVDGSERWEIVNAAPIYNEAGDLIAGFVAFPDLTELKRAEQALRQSEFRFKSLLEWAPIAIYETDIDGRCVYVNEKWRELAGLSLEDAMGSGWQRGLHEDDRARVFEEWSQHAQQEDAWDSEYRFCTPDGVVSWIMGRAKALQDSSGKVTGYLGVNVDITERKRVEDDKLALERQVQHVQKLESLGVLAGGIAHDFNNLLMAILGNADLALDELSPMSPARDRILEIELASKRAASLAKQMLAYSGKGSFVVGPIDAEELLMEMTHLLDVSISKKADLKFRFAKDLPQFEGDATQIRQVIMNLITNASEALGDQSGVIVLSTGVMDCERAYLEGAVGGVRAPLAEGEYVYFEVSDTGCGMDSVTMPKIFDPFFSTKFTGRGLGLSVVIGIMHGHAGALIVHSQEGKGTDFRALFPVMSVDKTPGVPVVARDDGPESEWTFTGTALIVDDEDAVRTVGGKMLRHLGFEVLSAADGRAGIEVLKAHTEEIDIVLLDLTMPQMDGEEAFHEMRRIRPNLAILLCSGFGEQDATQRLAKEGLAGFIQKPFDIASLQAGLKRALPDS